MKKRNGMTKEHWDQAIRDGYEAGLRVAYIANLIGSTPGSVKVMAHNMGLRHPHAGKGRYPKSRAA